MKKYILILILLCFLPSGVIAFDFVVDGVYYNITSRFKRTVEVTHWEERTNERGQPQRVFHHHNCTHDQSKEPLTAEHLRLIQLDQDANERAKTAYIGKVVVPSHVWHKGIKYKVAGVGDGSFYGRKQLTEISLPSGITYINRSAFENCIALKTIRIPSSVTRIDFAAFRYCMAITEMVLPDKLTTLGLYAISHCKNLAYVRMSPNVLSFHGNAFFHSPSLKVIELPHILPPVVRNDEGLTMDFKKITFQVPAESLSLYKSDPYWSKQKVQTIQK